MQEGWRLNGGDIRQQSDAFRFPGMYFATRLLSQSGQGVFIAGLFVLAGQQNSTAIGLSSVLVAMMAGSILMGLPGGAFADRLGAPRALVFGAIGRMLMIAAALVLAGRPELAALVAFGYSAFSQVYSPAEMALVRAIAPSKPAGAHALLVALQYAGQGAGILILAPLAFFIGGAEAMIATGLLIYVAVTVVASLLALSGVFSNRIQPVRNAFTLRGTLHYMAREPHAVYAGSLLAFTEMAVKSMVIILPVYVAHDLGLQSVEMAALLIPGGIGVVIGLVWASRGLHLHIAPQVVRLTLIGAVVSVVALAGLGNGLAMVIGFLETGPFSFLQNATHLSVAVAVPVALLLGMCFVVAPIGARTILTATAPRGEQGRVFATQATVADILMIAPLMLAGVGAELAGARVTLLFIGALGVALFALLEMHRIRRCVDAPLQAHVEVVGTPRPGLSEA